MEGWVCGLANTVFDEIMFRYVSCKSYIHVFFCSCSFLLFTPRSAFCMLLMIDIGCLDIFIEASLHHVSYFCQDRITSLLQHYRLFQHVQNDRVLKNIKLITSSALSSPGTKNPRPVHGSRTILPVLQAVSCNC